MTVHGQAALEEVHPIFSEPEGFTLPAKEGYPRPSRDSMREAVRQAPKLEERVEAAFEEREATGRRVPVEPAVVARMVTHWRADPPES